jgi:hypothetical protein
MNPGLNRSPLPQMFNLGLLVCNGLGIAVYLVLASRAWAIPEERALGLNSTTGEPFVWAISVFPIYAVFLLLNCVWGIRLLRRHDWRSGRFWIATFGLWVGAVVIDFAHH